MGSDWKNLSIDDLKAPEKNSIAIGPFGSRMKSDCYVATGVKVIRGTNITSGRTLSGDFVFISNEKAKELGSANLQANDLVFPHRGSIGEVGIVPNNGEKYVISSSLMKLTCDTSKVLPLFVYYFFKSAKGKFELLKNASQVGTPGIGQPLASLKSIFLSIPTIDEQKNIVEIFDVLDKRIHLLQQTNTTLEAIAQALFKSWFVDFDPVHAKQQGREPQGMDSATASLFPDSFEESALGLVPTGWLHSTLGAICNENSGAIQTGPFGSQLHSSDYIEAGIPVVMPQDLCNRRVNVTNVARIGEKDVVRLKRHQLKLNDIVFSRRGDVGRHALIGQKEVGWLCGTGCLLVRPGEKWPSPIYLSIALNQANIKEWLLRHAVGATMPNLNTGILSATPITIPNPKVLAAFNHIVCALDEKISCNHSQIALLTESLDHLLPRLISGKLTIPAA